MPKKTILVVDDEKDLLDLIEYNLKKEGYEVLKADNGLDGISLTKQKVPDLIILDVMMPHMNGIEVCEVLRKNENLHKTPIVFLTARSDERTEIESLNIGGDDFLTKPISTTKLISRINAVMRRVEDTSNTINNIIQVHDLKIDRERYLVTRNSDEFQLPKKEFELLFFLASRKGKSTRSANIA